MTQDQARQIIRDHYSAVARRGTENELYRSVIYLSQTLAEHMTWDAAIHLAEWIEQHDATAKRS